MDGVLQGAAGGGQGMNRIRLILFALLPLVLLGAMIGLLLSSETLLLGPSPVPPEALQRLTLERMAFYPGEIVVWVRNTGPGPSRLARATVTIPYDWVEGEPHEVRLITDAGLVFKKQVDVTTATPVPG